jgi:CBS domain containing-hemolysin-like protein
MSTSFTKIVDKTNTFHRHFPTALLYAKIVVVVFTIVFFIVELCYIGTGTTIPKSITIINSILFYLIGGFVIIILGVMLYVFRNTILNVFTFYHHSDQPLQAASPLHASSSQKNTKKLIVKKNNKQQSEDKKEIKILKFYLSLSWWLDLYFIILMSITIIAVATKNYSLITYAG